MSVGSRRNELVKLGELVGSHLRGPYADLVRTRIAQWRDPRAKAIRRRRRALRTAKLWTGAGVTTGAGAVVVETAIAAPGVGGAALIGAAAVSGIAAITSGVRSWRLHREPLPPPVHVPAPLPVSSSLARDPMRALREAEDALRVLLAQLGRSAVVPPDAVHEATATGAEAATALRSVADQLQALERARDHAPPRDAAHLHDSVLRLRAQLDHGVDGYRELVAAAGKALAATSPHTPRTDLTDATDRLAALASALRDLAR